MNVSYSRNLDLKEFEFLYHNYRLWKYNDLI